MTAIVCAAILSLGDGGAKRCDAAAPQTNLGSPFQTGGNSFFENIGVNFGFNIPAPLPTGGGSAVVGLTPQGAINPGGINFVQGGAAAAVPPFGGFVPGGDTFGFMLNSGRGSASFGLAPSQGSSTFLTSQTPSVTVMDGGTGFFAATSLRAFVTSVVPVVGGFGGGFAMPGAAEPIRPVGSSALQERLQRLGETPGPRGGPIGRANGPNGTKNLAGPNDQVAAAAAPQDEFRRELVAARQSTAGQPAAGIAEIRAQQAIAEEAAEAELRLILARAEGAMALGKPNVARIYYQQLARRATGSLKDKAQEGLKATESQPQSPHKSADHE